MKLTSALRTPYRVRAIVRPGASGSISDATLGRAIVLTQVVLLVLSVARVAVDRVRGPLGVEGGIALGLVVGLLASLAAKFVRWAAGRSRRGRPGTPSPVVSSALMTGGNHVRAS